MVGKAGKAGKSGPKSALELTLDELFTPEKSVFNPFSGFSKLLGSIRPRMKSDKAFLALLAAATEADGFVTSEERQELIAICHRTPFFEAMSLEALEELRASLVPRLTKKKIADLTEHAARSVPKAYRLSVFAHVVDLIMADRVVLQSERQFVERLQILLKISDEDASRIARALKIKNAH